MGSIRYEIEKFTGAEDFTLWTKKIKVILITQKVAKDLEALEELPATVTTNDQKQNMEEVAYATLLLNISNNVLHRVIK